MNINKIRKLEIECIQKIISDYNLAEIIEKSVFNRAIFLARKRNIFKQNEEFISIYSNIGYYIKSNLDPNSSINKGDSYVLDLIKEKKIDPEKIADLNPQELNPKVNKKYLEELYIRSQQHVTVKYVTRHRCSQCGERKTQEYEKNSRRGDEGGTLFITCLCCGHHWRIN